MNSAFIYLKNEHLINQLKVALEQSEFLLHYHPQVDLSTGKVIGMEALIRWQDSTRGLVFPRAFMPMVEQSDLAYLVGKWVLNEVCRQIVEWRKAALPVVPVSINVSANQLDKEFVAEVINALETYAIPPQLLVIEITESVLVSDPLKVSKSLNRLRDLHVQIHLDDFGNGYSSLAYLHQLPVTHLKIDKTFIDELEVLDSGKARSLKLVRAIIDLAHSLALKVIAEGVESKQQLEILSDLGCDYVQGFYFAKPYSADDVWQFIRKIDEAGLAYRFSTRLTRIGDYVLDLVPLQSEVQLLQKWQASLQILFGGTQIGSPYLLCQTFELYDSSRLGDLKHHLRQDLKYVRPFPLTAISLDTFFSYFRQSNLIRWQIETTPEVQRFITLITQTLITSGIAPLKFPGWIPKFIPALEGTAPLISQNYSEKIQFPQYLFTASRVVLKQYKGSGEFHDLDAIDFL